jgi:NAD(P)-dependent dehydrogenase (short-subunit alcohol dehydrogenase family)
MSRPVAVVTGASRGIGKRFCIDLARNGYDVVATARSSDDSRGKLPGTVEETAALARKEGAQALAVSLDVRDEGAIAKLADQVYDAFGRCDLVVNNAALAPPKAALDDSTKRWRLGVDVNVNGPFYFVYYFAPRMAEAGGGRIVNISSAAAVLPGFGARVHPRLGSPEVRGLIGEDVGHTLGDSGADRPLGRAIVDHDEFPTLGIARTRGPGRGVY